MQGILHVILNSFQLKVKNVLRGANLGLLSRLFGSFIKTLNFGGDRIV